MRVFATRRARTALCLAFAVLVAPLGAGGGTLDPSVLVSGPATMQQVMLPARPARVVQVPGAGGSEAWAIALSAAPVPGWHSADPSGQVVFLRYARGSGWTLDGPPVDESGRIVNPTLFDFAVAANGEGWAVGLSGALVHRRPGGRWVLTSQRPVAQDLRSVSLVQAGGGIAGFAVGDGPSIIRLADGTWTGDGQSTLVTTNLTAVAAVSATEAWAVSGNGDKELWIWHRTFNGWSRVTTGDTTFDGPHPSQVGTHLTVRQASGASVAAAPGGAWIGGVVYVSDVSNPFGDDSGRPFAIRVGAAGVRTYCAPAFEFSGQNTTEEPICDEHFPLAQYDVTSIQVLGNGDVFAGGQGLFHFHAGAWTREPDTNGYLISIAFASPTEGWAASTGAIYGAGGSAYSSLLTLGHWTNEPERPAMARWPQPNNETLEAIALAPDGSGDAVAVGNNGVSVFYLGGQAWDTVPAPSTGSLHAVAWPSRDTAWAVGDLGAISRFDGRGWVSDPASGVLTNRSLLGLAFRNGVAYAVGMGGAILRYSGGRWSVDPQSGRVTRKNLQAVTATPDGFVAVGEDATVLEHRGGGWETRAEVGRMVTSRSGVRPALSVAARLVDGTVVVGGAGGALAWRAPLQSAFARVAVPLDATILAVAGSRQALFASVSQAGAKWAGSRLAAPSSALLVHRRGMWQDVSHAGNRSISFLNDPSAPSDALFSIVTDASGTSGWAVGGTLVNTEDDDRHVFAAPTSAIWRFSLTGDPSPPDDTVAPDLPSGRSFAFFSDSSCAAGLCAAAIGSGNKADLVAAQIQREIQAVAGLANAPEFVMFGGNMRASGHPEELAEFRRFLGAFTVPVFGAVGDRDLFSASVSQTSGTINAVTPSNSIYLTMFAGEAGPWGDRPAPSGIRAVSTPASPVAGQARTHYAFDVLDAQAKPVYRVIVLDSSRRKLDSTGQNPSEDQLKTFLPTVLTSARAAGLPSIIVMNQPSLNPYFLGSSQVNFTPPTDEAELNSLVATNGTKAVVSGGFPINAFYVPAGTQTPVSPGGVPFYVGGGGGRAFELTKTATDGFYHAWLLVTVAGSGPSAKVSVTTFPVVDSIALHSVNGAYVEAGNPMLFRASARFPAGGFSDLGQAKALYAEVPFVGRCSQAGLYSGTCANRNALIPSYSFTTSDPSKAMFVKWDPGLEKPYRDPEGNLVADDQAGYLCTFQTGWVDVYVTMGLHRATRPVYVDGGFGPCVDKPVPRPAVKGARHSRPVTSPDEVEKHYFFRPPLVVNQVTIIPPVPAPIIAPAPPGAPGVGRKEEHEVQTETEGHASDVHRFVAASRASPHDAMPWVVGAGMIGAFGLGVVATMVARRRRQPAYLWESRR